MVVDTAPEIYTYRWFVLLGAAIVNGLTWGMSYSVGVMYSEWTAYFDASPAYISLVGGLPTSVGCLCGKVDRCLYQRYRNWGQNQD